MASPFTAAPTTPPVGPFGGGGTTPAAAPQQPRPVAPAPAPPAPPMSTPSMPSSSATPDTAFDGPDPFSQPSEGGAVGPRVRDLDRRLVMVRKLSEEDRPGLKHKEGDALVRTLTCDVAVLSGGKIMMSPSQNDLEGVVTEWGDAPAVVEGMWINQKGLINRLKQPISLGWVTRSPMKALEKIGIDTPEKLNARLDADPNLLNNDAWSTNMFWTMLPHSDADAAYAREWLKTDAGRKFLASS